MSDYSDGAKLRYAAQKVYERSVKRTQELGWIGVQYLRNAELKVLSGQRSGRRCRVPGTGRVKYNKRTHKASVAYRKYTASAPGEPPAVRTGVFRTSWQMYVKDRPDGVLLRLNTSQNGRRYPAYLENGTRRMAPRPYVEPILAAAKPQIWKVYKNFHL